ncbi:MAG TPA: alpha/beta hydrolase [Streptosporangiaceae bacterium]|nr:alpha/beta hydrolase [Streptosporangiaceae bacterium]
MKFPDAARLTRLRFGLLAAVLAVVGLFAATAQIASASPSRAATGPKPTIVLEHGAWADSGSWNGVVQRLQHDGYTVYAPPDPLQGLAYDTATLKDFLGTIPGPIVLVGHSYGGMVITNAATGNKNVKALVYDDAFIPAQGDTAGSLSGARPGSCLAVANPATVFNLVPFPGAPKGVVDAYVKPSVFPGCFANGLPASEGAVLAATQRPLATSVLTDKSGVPAWKTIPSWAIVGTADHVIPPAEQLFMAKRAGAHITEVHAPHLSMISNPGVVTETIIAAAQATG